ncbi:MAG TPA: sigma-70 family RNA polymerase sigma factor [Ilumatobacteraceae bacterium]
MAESFDDFYRGHRDLAVRWAVALVGRRDIAEELAQDALARTGQRLARLDEPAAYLRRSVVNACRSWHRSADRERRRIGRASAPVGGSSEVVSTASAEVLAALRALPYPQRAAVVLRFWADWSDADIADSLGCKPASVRVLVHRGITRLREELQP